VKKKRKLLLLGIPALLALVPAWGVSIKTAGNPFAIIVGWFAFFCCFVAVFESFTKFEK
jgi:hypothetical protein